MALDDFAQAINRRDDKAIREMVCQADAGGRSSGTLADPFAGSAWDVDRIDPRLRDLHYEAKAGDVTSQGVAEATGELTFSAQGIPKNLSSDARRVLESGTTPFPLGLVGQDHTVRLVKEGGRWLVCGRSSPSTAALGGDAAAVAAVLELRPVLATRNPVSSTPVQASRPPTTTSDPAAVQGELGAGLSADLEALAVSGCGKASPAASHDADRQLVTCSVDGDTVYALGPVELSGDEIVAATPAPEPGGYPDWAIEFTTSEQGKTQFEQTTRRLSALGSPRNQLPIVVDGLVMILRLASPDRLGEASRDGMCGGSPEAVDLGKRDDGASPVRSCRVRDASGTRPRYRVGALSCPGLPMRGCCRESR